MHRIMAITLSCAASVLCLSPALAQLGKPAQAYDVRVKRCLDQKGIKYRISDKGNFVVSYEVGDDRTQVAWIVSKTETYRDFEIREIWSIGYKSATDAFPASVANRLLEDTESRKLGAWSKEGRIASFAVKIAADADSDSLIDAVLAVVNTTDAVEKELTDGKDEF